MAQIETGISPLVSNEQRAPTNVDLNPKIPDSKGKITTAAEQESRRARERYNMLYKNKMLRLIY